MYISCRKYPVMEGEPHLGTMEECELTVENEEVWILVTDEAFDCGFVPSTVTGIDDYTDEDIELDVSEYVDDDARDMANEYLACVEKPNRTKLYNIVTGKNKFGCSEEQI